MKPITLDDLKPKAIDIVIRDQRSETVLLAFPIVTLTYSEWESCIEAVPEPPVPIFAADADHPKPFSDDRDPVYLDKLNATREERESRVMFAMLEKAGNVFPGDTAKDKWQALIKTADRRLAIKMKAAILGTGWEGSTELVSRAESFPPEQA